MEGSEAGKQQPRKSNYYSYFRGMKVYHYLQQAIKAFLRFFGFGSAFSSKATEHSPSAVPETEVSMTEEFTVINSRGIALRSRGPVKKPPTPPVRSGRVGQIHSI